MLDVIMCAYIHTYIFITNCDIYNIYLYILSVVPAIKIVADSSI